jgi:hypothetical protein
MREGEIILTVAGEAPIILPIKDGAFSGNAAVGNNRAEVFSYKAGPPLSTDPTGAPTKVNFIPDKYNGHSKLEMEVTASGPNESSFAITSN